MIIKKLTTPLKRIDIQELKAGDQVLLSGKIYTARDTAHSRLVKMLNQGRELPFSLKDSTIYYVGPSPARPGRVIGAAGPTTSYRMDPYTPSLLAKGLRAMIGKGPRSPKVIKALKEYGAIYLGATGGAAALLAKSIIGAKVIAFAELGPEAVRELEIVDMPLIVINDCFGNDLYEQAVAKYRRNSEDKSGIR